MLYCGWLPLLVAFVFTNALTLPFSTASTLFVAILDFHPTQSVQSDSKNTRTVLNRFLVFFYRQCMLKVLDNVALSVLHVVGLNIADKLSI